MTYELASPKRSSVMFFSIATNHYVNMLEELLAASAKDIKSLEWHYTVATDDPDRLGKFAETIGLGENLTLIPCPPYTFPLASMLRFKYMKTLPTKSDFICYMDCDMKIEKPDELDSAIRKATKVSLVRHPGFARHYGLPLPLKEKLFELYSIFKVGGLGSWESKRGSEAYVPRARRKNYLAGGIFFGPAKQVIEMVTECDLLMDADLKKGIIAKVHDESYLNRWATNNDFTAFGPEFCFADYAWLPELRVVVRALEKGALVNIKDPRSGK